MSATTSSTRQRSAPLAKALRRQHAAALARIEALSADLAALETDADWDVADRDGEGKGSTTAVDRDRTLSLLHAAREHLEGLEEALARCQAGTYGRCASCGGYIPTERLEALPTALTCLVCMHPDPLRRRSPTGG